MLDIRDMARYIGLSLLQKGASVSPLKLQKILYYTQAWHMVFFGREATLFNEAPQAWVNGPVYPDIYYIYRDKVDDMCKHLSLSDFDVIEKDLPSEIERLAVKMQLSRDQIECIDSIITLYGGKTQNALIALTHSEKPWVEQRAGLSPFDRSQKEISLDTMYQYYKERHDRVRNGK